MNLLIALILMVGQSVQPPQPKVIVGAQTHGTFPVPSATGAHPEPIWFESPRWDQYPMPGFWQCPIGYEQADFDGKGRMSASLHGEMSGGSADRKHKPTCELPKKEHDRAVIEGGTTMTANATPQLKRGDNAICNGCSVDNEFDHPERIFGRTSTPGCVSCFDDTAVYNGATFSSWDKFTLSVENAVESCAEQKWVGSASYWSALGNEWVELQCDSWKRFSAHRQEQRKRLSAVTTATWPESSVMLSTNAEYKPLSEPVDVAPTFRSECRYWLGGEQERFRAIWGECAKGLLYMGGVEERKIETCLDKKRIFLHSEDGKGHCVSLKTLEGRWAR